MVARWLVVLAAASGCATATVAGDDDDVLLDARIDAPPGTIDARIDAPPGTIDAAVDAPIAIDAPTTQTITLSQGSNTITPLNTIACSNQTTGFTAENSFYRSFRLADHGVTTAFTANRVDLGIETAAGAGGSQTIQVRLYTVAGAFPAGVLTPIAGQSVTVPDQSNTVIQVPLSPAGVAPAGSTIVAEVFTPDGRTVGNTFYIGSNTAAETQPSYIRAPICGSTNPVSYATAGFPTVHIVLTVTGTY